VAKNLCCALIPGSFIQSVVIVTSKAQRSAAPNGANVTSFVHIVARQVFLSSLLGVKSMFHIFARVPLAAEVLVTIVGLSAILYAIWCGPVELRLFVLFVATVFAAALANPLATLDGTQWEILSVPGAGNRYFFLPEIAFLAALIWIVTASGTPRKLITRTAACAMLLALPIGIVTDWHYRSFADLHFRRYARVFEEAAPGTHVTIPINPPGWSMELSKH